MNKFIIQETREKGKSKAKRSDPKGDKEDSASPFGEQKVVKRFRKNKGVTKSAGKGGVFLKFSSKNC